MRVERVVFPFTNEKIGGSHVSSFTLGTTLQRDHGVDVVVACPKGSLIEEVARERSFRIWPLDEKPAFRHGLVAEARLLPQRLAILAGQPRGTVIHNNDLSAQQSWGPAARLRGIACVYHNRAFNRPVLPNLLVMATAQRIVCISRAVEERLPEWLRRRSVRIDNPFELPAEVDGAALRRRFAEEFPVAREGPLIGFIGNFAERKRPRFFLEMARAVLLEMPRAVFVIFGRAVDETQQDLAAFAAQLGIADRVIFAGFRLPVEENIALLDLLAITAVEEPLGRTPLEALMLGVPYVATDDAGLGETARRFGGGLLVPRGAGPGAFAATVVQALGTMLPDFTEERQCARDSLSAVSHAAQILKVYEALLG